MMLTLPSAILGTLSLRAGATVNITVDDSLLVTEANPQPCYTLVELLAASDYAQPRTAEDQEWIEAPTIGSELI